MATTLPPSIFMWKPTAADASKVSVEAANVQPFQHPDPRFNVVADRSSLTFDAKTGALLAGTARALNPEVAGDRTALDQATAKLRSLGITGKEGNIDTFQLSQKMNEDPNFLGTIKPGQVAFSYMEGDPFAGQWGTRLGYVGEIAKAPQAVRDAIAAVEAMGASWQAQPIDPNAGPPQQ
jgi:hypothetical protein